MKYGRPRIQHAKAGEIGSAISKAMQRTLLDNVPARESLDQAKADIEAALRR